MTKSPAQLDLEVAIAVGPGPKPKDPRDISFDPKCFVEVGRRVEYVLRPHPGSAGYPEHFTLRAAAEARARRTGRRIVEESVPVRKRIRWR